MPDRIRHQEFQREREVSPLSKKNNNLAMSQSATAGRHSELMDDENDACLGDSLAIVFAIIFVIIAIVAGIIFF